MKKFYFVMMTWLAVLMMPASVDAAVQDPEALVKETSDKILTMMRKERDLVSKNPTRVYELVDEIVLPHFDFARMSAWVLGKYWRTANDGQKSRFTREFRTLLVRTYAKALVDNMDQTIEFLPTRRQTDAAEVTVQTEVPQPGGFPIPINYDLYLQNSAWKVYDVNIDGISLVANYRTSFAKEAKEQGLDKLIDTLAKRNAQAANE